MKLVFINQTRQKLPRKHLQQVFHKLQRFLLRKGFKKSAFADELVLVFLPEPQARQMNQQFRGKDYATDVLSFSSEDPGCFGELVFCPKVLHRQAGEQGHALKWELTYMFIHGVLHLLGLDHERSIKEERRMFALQDDFFATLKS